MADEAAAAMPAEEVEEAEEEKGIEAVEPEAGDAPANSPEVSALPANMRPLEHSWTFLYYIPTFAVRNASWESSIKPIYTFNNMDGFWSFFRESSPPSRLIPGTDLHCFKHNIEPKWYDPACANGGKWSMRFPRGKTDWKWMNTLNLMIGERFDYADEICGAVISVRSKEERIDLWTKNAANEAVQLSIGEQWKGIINYKDTMGFISHEDAQNLQEDAKNLYTV